MVRNAINHKGHEEHEENLKRYFRQCRLIFLPPRYRAPTSLPLFVFFVLFVVMLFFTTPYQEANR